MSEHVVDGLGQITLARQATILLAQELLELGDVDLPRGQSSLAFRSQITRSAAKSREPPLSQLQAITIASRYPYVGYPKRNCLRPPLQSREP